MPAVAWRVVQDKNVMRQNYTTYLKWQAAEFRHYPKNIAWYITALLVIGLLVVYQIIKQDWFGAISISILAAFIVIYGRHIPGTMEVQISDKGVHLGDSVIPYTHIKHFWIVHNDKHQVLNIETTAYINHLIGIELEEQDPDEVKNILQKMIPEHTETQETLAQRIAHRFKF